MPGEPEDVVRQEIRVALDRDVFVLPVLLDGAGMPAASDLPSDLHGLAATQALDTRIQQGLGRMGAVGRLGSYLATIRFGVDPVVRGTAGALSGLARAPAPGAVAHAGIGVAATLWSGVALAAASTLAFDARAPAASGPAFWCRDRGARRARPGRAAPRGACLGRGAPRVRPPKRLV